MPEKLANEYKKQMALPDLVFLTQDNQEKIKEAITPEVFEAKQKELAEQSQKDARYWDQFIKDKWICSICKCVNAGELKECSDCKVSRPEAPKDPNNSFAEVFSGPNDPFIEAGRKIREQMEEENKNATTSSNEPTAT